ncbi:hypothetical protein EYR40_008353 [Pleurotus pulmonarius]|nr:hypothetical protein EYR40_008353 [Pleurotus pulmonarius]
MPVTRPALKRKQREFDDVELKDEIRPATSSKYKGRPRPLHGSVLKDHDSIERSDALRKLKMEDVIERLEAAKREWEACDGEESLSEEERDGESEDDEKGEEETEKYRDFFDLDERALVSGWRDPVLRDFGSVASMPARQRLKMSSRSGDKAEWGARESHTGEQQEKAGNAGSGADGREAEAGAGEPDVEAIAKDNLNTGKQKCSASVQEEIAPESEEEGDYSIHPLHGHVSTISLDSNSDPEPSDDESEGTDLLWSYPIGHRIAEHTYPSEGDFDVDEEAEHEDPDDDDGWDSSDEEEYARMLGSSGRIRALQREPLSEEEVLHMCKGNLLKLAVHNASRENLIKRIIEENWLRHRGSPSI